MTLIEAAGQAKSLGVYLSVAHNGIVRDVYPYEVRDGKLWCWCSLHPWRGVESMYLYRIGQYAVTDTKVDWDVVPEYGSQE